MASTSSDDRYGSLARRRGVGLTALTVAALLGLSACATASSEPSASTRTAGAPAPATSSAA